MLFDQPGPLSMLFSANLRGLLFPAKAALLASLCPGDRDPRKGGIIPFEAAEEEMEIFDWRLSLEDRAQGRQGFFPITSRASVG